MADEALVRWFEDISNDDVADVGGKNASLGELLGTLGGAGIRVPAGFATTAAAYRLFLRANDLPDRLREQLGALDRGAEPGEVGPGVRKLLRDGELPPALRDALAVAYERLSARYDTTDVDAEVRSSATAEDLPEASFAGQQESFLNVSGVDDLHDAVRACFVSLFTDRAIAYREQQGFDHLEVALSAGVQKMVRSDLAGAGVLFTLDTDSGFPDVVSIDAAWGLGESVVAGTVNPDNHLVFKPLLDDERYRPVIGRTLGAKATEVVYAAGGRTETRDVEEERRRRFVLSEDEVLAQP